MAENLLLDITDFVKLSTALVTDMREWIQQATLRDTLAEEQLLVLNSAADIIDTTTTRLAAAQPDPSEELIKNPPLV